MFEKMQATIYWKINWVEPRPKVRNFIFEK
jgi:hypothetical protein